MGIYIITGIRSGNKYEFINRPDAADIRCEIIEVLNIVGLNHVRALNHPFSAITLDQNHYHQGLLVYKRDDNDSITTNMRFNNYRMIARFAVKFTHKPLIKLLKGDSHFAAETSDDQSHLVVFEHVFRDVDEELVISMKKVEELFDYAFYNEWKMVDIDGFFGGNSFKRDAGRVVIEDFRQ